MSNDLERVIALAALAHSGQYDKAGMPYILHPLAVMLKMRTYDEKVVAVLHDIVEDTHVTADTLKKLGLKEKVIFAVVAITRKKDETWKFYLNRVKRNPLARAVKIQDLLHNADLSRLEGPGEADIQRAAKYRKATEFLNAFL